MAGKVDDREDTQAYKKAWHQLRIQHFGGNTLNSNSSGSINCHSIYKDVSNRIDNKADIIINNAVSQHIDLPAIKLENINGINQKLPKKKKYSIVRSSPQCLKSSSQVRKFCFMSILVLCFMFLLL